jgi:hypothetical protein
MFASCGSAGKLAADAGKQSMRWAARKSVALALGTIHNPALACPPARPLLPTAPSLQSMIPKSGIRFSDKIMIHFNT